jgi:tRNA pseudouridine13 synthase
VAGRSRTAHGGPVLRGRLRGLPEDFEVEEQRAFGPSGVGEHAWLEIEKRGANTEWVARELARFAGVPPVAVGYAGLKDRHAVTRQAFTVHLPGRPDPDWSALPIEGVRVLSAPRHARKLARGALSGNRFRLVVREVEGDRAAAERLLARIARAGIPNRFGEQRFGVAAGNLDAAAAMFAGRRVARAERSRLLSVARSAIFNAVLDARIEDGTWNRALDGDVFQLDGSGSIFGPEPVDAALAARVEALAIHPTGPLWGRGAPRVGGAVAALEARIAAEPAWAALARGLETAGVEAARRALRVRVAGLAHRWLDPQTLELRFELPPGAYATAVAAELVATDPADRPGPDPVSADSLPRAALKGA